MKISINLYDSVKDVDRKLAKLSDADKDWLLAKAEEAGGDRLLLNFDEFLRLLTCLGEKHPHFVIR